jgi:hypothetical protein
MTFQLEIRTADEIAAEAAAGIRLTAIALVDAHVEARAQAMGYNSAVSCVSYRDSGVSEWVAEAEQFGAWRDSVWQALMALEAQQAVPATPEALIAALPVWPG